MEKKLNIVLLLVIIVAVLIGLQSLKSLKQVSGLTAIPSSANTPGVCDTEYNKWAKSKGSAGRAAWYAYADCYNAYWDYQQYLEETFEVSP